MLNFVKLRLFAAATFCIGCAVLVLRSMLVLLVLRVLLLQLAAAMKQWQPAKRLESITIFKNFFPLVLASTAAFGMDCNSTSENRI